ncbi:uncharacterized protein Z519_11273 [Cladophialophora bantiana CBS 173.52]|uniref:Aldehyde dehydrogenase domain-containing protein n=1 Tax=Cladophialophora bantiana (strain ATCC 10958 / CBS 173.52 / CDC B-1940 / NIH 8579) TaxID=1442370 RepID=A0A0D2FN60_CLAB1|nr:uncharacterized protein Z519_11273 [Cladophialophora bantiana CBS 173.52]KIW88162.1 hypothetical protein Z519_11273 [Cladophialophora bantiana CBS 173.52]
MYLQISSSGAVVVPNVIGGDVVSLPESQNFPVIQGSTGNAIHCAQSATVDVGIKAVETAAEVFKTWRKTPLSRRRAVLNKAADILETKAEELAKREISETSCDPHWPEFGVTYASKFVRETSANVSTVHGSIPDSEVSGTTSLVFREPVGVVLTVIPWNAPIILACRGIAAALAAGCTLVLEVFTEEGLPAGALNKIQCSRADGPAVTEAIISHLALRKVEFIGSAAVGRIIGSIAGRHLKPVLMELGDQSPVIILEDADLKAAAENCVRGTVAHHGQICFGTERIIVHQKVAQEFIQLLVEATEAVPSTGHAITIEAAKRAHEEAVADDAKYLVGTAKYTGRTSLEPSILTDVRSKSRLSHEESFALSATLYVVNSDEEALVLANNTPYGLSASVFTRNHAKGLAVARDLEFGQVQINSHTMSVNGRSLTVNEVSAAQTGFKGSGWGSNGAAYGIGEFLFSKHVSLTL